MLAAHGVSGVRDLPALEDEAALVSMGLRRFLARKLSTLAAKAAEMDQGHFEGHPEGHFEGRPEGHFEGRPEGGGGPGGGARRGSVATAVRDDKAMAAEQAAASARGREMTAALLADPVERWGGVAVMSAWGIQERSQRPSPRVL